MPQNNTEKIIEEEIEDIKLMNGEWDCITPEEGDSISCCDCGLNHLVNTKIEDRKVFLSFERDEEMTKRNRREIKYKIQPISQTLAEVIGWTERLDADGCDFVSTEKIREYILSLKQKYE